MLQTTNQISCIYIYMYLCIYIYICIIHTYGIWIPQIYAPNRPPFTKKRREPIVFLAPSPATPRPTRPEVSGRSAYDVLWLSYDGGWWWIMVDMKWWVYGETMVDEIKLRWIYGWCCGYYTWWIYGESLMLMRFFTMVDRWCWWFNCVLENI